VNNTDSGLLRTLPKRIFGPKGQEEVTGGWRKLHNGQLHNFYCSQNITRLIESWWMRWADHVAHGALKNTYKICVGKSE
jgi:hypothetical protein